MHRRVAVLIDGGFYRKRYRETYKGLPKDPRELARKLYSRAMGHAGNSLYEALAPGAKPRFDIIVKVARALGVRLTAHPAHAPSEANKRQGLSG